MPNPRVSPIPGPHLVIGSGQVGSQIATQLAAIGAEVILVTRSGAGPVDPDIRRVAADASDLDALIGTCPSAAVIYNAANPPYQNWPRDWPPLAAAFLDYAERTGAVLATVSNLYGYGPVTEPMREDMPLVATGSKARVRIQMWLDMKAANDAGRVRATEVRGSDYICPGQQSYLGDRVVPRVLVGKSVQLLGDPDAPHTMTAPADVATTLIVAANSEVGWGRPWHVPSNPAKSLREAVADIAATAEVSPVRVSRVPSLALKMLGLVQPVIRELEETAYQRERPYILDDSAARTQLGVSHTLWPDIVAGLVASYR